MNTKPIIFSAEMIRALLDGRKSQTRRICTAKDVNGKGFDTYSKDAMDALIRNGPYGKPGDLLWVREAFYIIGEHPGPWPRSRWTHYRADASNNLGPDEWQWTGPWKPSIHMPRKASRLTLHITNVRVERVQDISDEAAKAEGAQRGDMKIEDQILPGAGSYRTGFANLWQAINGKRGYGWAENPWCWVIEFEVIKQNVDELIAGASNYAGVPV